MNFSNGFLSGDNYEYYTNPANVIKITAHYDPKDSVVATIYSYINKKENCLYTSYYKDGTTKAFEGNYGDVLHGKTGTWNYWDENGKLIKQSDYDVAFGQFGLATTATGGHDLEPGGTLPQTGLFGMGPQRGPSICQHKTPLPA